MRASIMSVLSLAAWSAVGGPAALAQGMSAGDSYVMETSAKPGCRAAVLHIVRSGGALSGVVFFKDASGASSVNGQTDGRTFNWTMTSMSGQGPTGQVTGSVTPEGALQARLTGTNCTLDTVVPRYRDVTTGGG